MTRFLRSICAVAAAAATAAGAQIYPAKPITLVSGFPPGGSTDIVARQLAAKLSQRFGQQVVVAGEVQVVFDGMPGPLAHIRAGKVHALGVTGDKRLGVLPDVKSFAEQGVSGVDAQFWWGIVVPAGTPQPIIARLNAEIAQALADPEIRATFEKQNIDPSPGTPEAFGAWIAAERVRWAGVVAKAGIKPE